MLIASGADDPVGNMGKGVKKLYRFYTQKAGMRSVSLKLFEGSRHEFLNERPAQKKSTKNRPADCRGAVGFQLNARSALS